MVLGPGSFSVFTEEALGQAEKTELYAHLANRLGKAESTKRGAEKIMKQTEVTLNQTQMTFLSPAETGHNTSLNCTPSSPDWPNSA
ncbi:endophilin-B1-like isoform X5 [Narcine bancroftii]|uniref:endophilin-B1-like isoform X5 n=1 Tax=Narcine bancroftii TaxID=1343680 RepID=UPI003831EEDF